MSLLQLIITYYTITNNIQRMKQNKLGRPKIEPKFKRKQIAIGVRYVDIMRHGGEDALKDKLMAFIQAK
jgi:hypothetical protein